MIITFNGSTKPLREWCATLGMTEICLRKRLAKMSVQEAFTKPLESRGGNASKRIVTVGGFTGKIKGAANHFGVNPTVVYARLDLGWTMEQAVGIAPAPERVPWNKGKTGMSNSMTVRTISIAGKERTFMEASQEYGIEAGVISARVKYLGWTPEEAVGLTQREKKTWK